jgi:hypothetical protein
MKKQAAQPWIEGWKTDSSFILLPPFVSLLLVIIFPAVFQNQQGLSDAWWVVLILLIDVAHVYSTLYRTYFNKAAFAKDKTTLLIIPFLAFIVMVLLYTQSPLWFWRILAYAAVFHFIRQQYGFMRIYSRKEINTKWYRHIDAVAIYAATVYPIIYWHFSGNRQFSWFVDGDFFDLSQIDFLLILFAVTYIIILLLYLIKEIVLIYKTGNFNIPRNAVILGTVLSWYFGIVYFNGDMSFTLLNVVSHGVPYMALVWMYGRRTVQKAPKASNKLMQYVFSRYGILLFLAIIFFFAFIEEGLWDMTLWKDHKQVFSIFHWVDVQFSKEWLQLMVPLLALPQVTHYIVDGFIWRIKKDELKWSDNATQ